MDKKNLISVLLGVAGVLLMSIMGWGASSLDRLTMGVNDLNIKMAVIVDRVGHHEGRISKLEDKNGKSIRSEGISSAPQGTGY